MRYVHLLPFCDTILLKWRYHQLYYIFIGPTGSRSILVFLSKHMNYFASVRWINKWSYACLFGSTDELNILIYGYYWCFRIFGLMDVYFVHAIRINMKETRKQWYKNTIANEISVLFWKSFQQVFLISSFLLEKIVLFYPNPIKNCTKQIDYSHSSNSLTA